MTKLEESMIDIIRPSLGGDIPTIPVRIKGLSESPGQFQDAFPGISQLPDPDRLVLFLDFFHGFVFGAQLTDDSAIPPGNSIGGSKRVESTPCQIYREVRDE